MKSNIDDDEVLRGTPSSYTYNAPIAKINQNNGPIKLHFSDVQTPSHIVKTFLTKLRTPVISRPVIKESFRAKHDINYWVTIINSLTT